MKTFESLPMEIDETSDYRGAHRVFGILAKAGIGSIDKEVWSKSEEAKHPIRVIRSRNTEINPSRPIT
jgi:hypothetical protein